VNEPASVDARGEAVARLGAALKGTLAAARRLRGRETHRPGEVSHAQHHLLHGLADGPVRAGELAGAADLSPATVTQMLDHLESMGLVERHRSEQDRRIVTCSLTDRGYELAAERRSLMEARFDSALAGFGIVDLSAAAAVLDSLCEMFESLGAPRG
jgi:DNA-binding MarR family transcriptional regulator